MAGWFDQQRPNIPTSAAPAPVPGGGPIASTMQPIGGATTNADIPGIGNLSPTTDQRPTGGYDPNVPHLQGGMTTGQGINERAGAGEPPVNGFDANGVWHQGPGMTVQGGAIPGQQQGPMIPPTTAPSATGSLAGYTGAPININVPFNPQSFVGSDAYNFTKDEGLDALSRYHFANGTAGTGGFSRDVMKFASGNAANYWDKQLAHDTEIATGNANRTLGGLSSLAGNGLSAAGGQAGYGMEAGNAAASGTVDQASALNTGVSGAANSLAEYFARQRARRAGAQAGATPANYPAPTNPYPANPGPVQVGAAPGTPGGLFSGVDPNNPLIWHAR